MQHQGQTFPVQQPVYGAQAYPVQSVTVNVKRHYGSRVDNPDYEPRRQPLGYFLSVLFAAVVAFLGLICFSGIFFAEEKLVFTLLTIASCFMVYFMAVSLHYPEYLGGKPSSSKAWPMVLSYLFIVFAFTASSPQIFLIVFWIFSIFAWLQYLIMFQDDSSGNCVLNLKPWVYRRKYFASVAPPAAVQNYGQVPIQAEPQPQYQPPNPYQSNPHQSNYDQPPPYQTASYQSEPFPPKM